MSVRDEQVGGRTEEVVVFGTRDDDPSSTWTADQVQRGETLRARGEVMGLLTPDRVFTSRTLGELPSVLDRLVEGLGEAGVVMTLLRRAAAGHGLPRDAGLDALFEATELNALPDGEWTPLRERLGDGLLSRLLDISEASLRRYAGGQRVTPDAVAARLHWVALVVADLAGSFNDLGVRQWFRRPRTALGGRSPEAVLDGGFDPDGQDAARVRELARALVDLGAT